MAQVQILYCATGDGLVQLANPGTSDRWRAVGTALETQDVVAVRASAAEPLHAFAATAAGLYATLDGGVSWEAQHPGAVTALAAANDGTIYVGTRDGTILQGGTDAWIPIFSSSAPIVHLSLLPDAGLAAIDRNGGVKLYAAGDWRSGGFQIPCASELVTSTTTEDQFYISNEHRLVTRYGTYTLGAEATGALVLLPGKPEVLLTGSVGPVYRSDDGGGTFAPVEGPSGVTVLVSPPRYQDVAYAGTASGELWLSRDRGRTWRRLHEGMAVVRDLSFARVQ